MSNQHSSCTVAVPKQCNHATQALDNESTHATSMQPTSLKALADKVLSRNQPCNRDATEQEKPCNFSPQKSTFELQLVRLKKMLSKVGAEVVHEDSSHVLRFNPYLAGPQIDPERWAMALELEEMFFNHLSWKDGKGRIQQPICGQKRKEALPCKWF